MIVLCLHHIGTEAGAGAKYRQFLLSSAGLRRAIRSVRLLGMEIIPLADVLRDPAAFWQGRHANKVVLTFDDGYVNNLTEALPVLAEEKCPATVFAVAGKLGGYNDWDPDLPRAPLMTLEQMRQMTRTPGLTIGSHGLLHRRLQTLPPDELAREITESHAILSAGLGAAYIPALAYPYGNYSAGPGEGLAVPVRLHHPARSLATGHASVRNPPVLPGLAGWLSVGVSAEMLTQPVSVGSSGLTKPDIEYKLYSCVSSKRRSWFRLARNIRRPAVTWMPGGRR